MSDTREMLISAPVEQVWAVLTEDKYLNQWFGEADTEMDLRPGGKMVFRFKNGGVFSATIEGIEPPRYFAYRVLTVPTEAAPDDTNSRLIEFTLTADGPDRTRLGLAESNSHLDGIKRVAESI
ncbi:SRPBCC domain-containing protein [Streptomyces sp. NPDC020192]|uniref:SRPBCC domain-containing protein n=1 Tax=Streptomyces sp. NPDC020192 TaxID=3365066 RepID=UPI003796BD5B